MLPSDSAATPVAHSTNADVDQGPHRRLAVVLVVGGLIGLVAAVVLLVEKIALIENPAISRPAASTPSCPAGR